MSHKFEDRLRVTGADEQKRSRVRDSESGLEHRGKSDPYASYHSPSGEGLGPWNEGMETITHRSSIVTWV